MGLTKFFSPEANPVVVPGFVAKPPPLPKSVGADVLPKPPNPPKPLAVVVVVPKLPNNDCVVAGVLLNKPVPNPKLGVVLPNKLGAEVVVVPNDAPKSGVEVVVVLPNRPGAEVVGAPNNPVVCVPDPNKLILVAAGVENKLGVVVAEPNNPPGFVVAEPKKSTSYVMYCRNGTL